MPTITKNTDALRLRFARASDDTARAIAGASPEAQGLLARLDQTRFKDEPEQVLAVLTERGWRVLVGLGPPAALTPTLLRRIGGTLFAELAGEGIVALAVDLGLDPTQQAELAYGARLRAWRPWPGYRKTPDPDTLWHLGRITLVGPDPKAARAAFAALRPLAAAVHFARDLVVAPGNVLTPPAFVAALQAIPGLRCEVIDPKAAGLPLLQAVGAGSRHPPRLVLLHWPGDRPETPPVLLVGKGITFDTGGIDIKPRLHLEEMKGDMGGAAAVAGVLQALAARRSRPHVIGVLAIAENMPSGNALRPGDVIASHAGVSVEVIDTDAEGRLVLADALSYAAARFRPRLIIDLATLTGAVEVTLGLHRAGLFTADDRLAAALFAAGEVEDEKLWRLPLTRRYDAALKSGIADLRNCTWERGPDALHAARFLQHFVPDGIPWAHLDIAGLSEAAEDGPLAAEGPTGFGVRLLDHLLRIWPEAAG